MANCTRSQLVALVLLIVVAVLGIVGAVLDEWHTYSVLRLQTGIFPTHTNNAEFIKATEAFVILGLILVCLALLFSPFYLCGMTGMPMRIEHISLSCLVGSLGSGICLLVAVIIYGAKTQVNIENYGASFWLETVAAILGLLAGGYIFQIRNHGA